MNLGDYLWTLLVIFFMVTYFMIFLHVLTDLFRDRETSGLAKTAWVLLLFVVPVFGLFLYLIVRGRGMADRTLSGQKAAQQAQAEYIQSVVSQNATASTSASTEIAKASELLGSGAITQAEFDAIKIKALA
jgi:uncharacterized protein (DUF58 family)